MTPPELHVVLAVVHQHRQTFTNLLSMYSTAPGKSDQERADLVSGSKEVIRLCDHAITFLTADLARATRGTPKHGTSCKVSRLAPKKRQP
jgi:hypothetical protein